MGRLGRGRDLRGRHSFHRPYPNRPAAGSGFHFFLSRSPTACRHTLSRLSVGEAHEPADDHDLHASVGPGDVGERPQVVLLAVHYASSTQTSAAPVSSYLNRTRKGRQQTWQSSTYSCVVPPPESRPMTIVSPQWGQDTAASVSNTTSPAGASAPA